MVQQTVWLYYDAGKAKISPRPLPSRARNKGYRAAGPRGRFFNEPDCRSDVAERAASPPAA